MRELEPALGPPSPLHRPDEERLDALRIAAQREREALQRDALRAVHAPVGDRHQRRVHQHVPSDRLQQLGPPAPPLRALRQLPAELFEIEPDTQLVEQPLFARVGVAVDEHDVVEHLQERQADRSRLPLHRLVEDAHPTSAASLHARRRGRERRLHGRMLLLVALACAPHVPSPPKLPQWSDASGRDALPELTIRVAHLANFEGTESQVVAGGGRGTLAMSAEALIVEHPSRGVVLIDSGYACRSKGHPEVYPGKFTANVLSLDVTSCAVERLAEVGLAPGDVTTVVLTHLHHDHAGGVEDFPAARLVVDAVEWQAGARHRPLKGYQPEPYAGRTVDPIRFDGTWPFGPVTGHVDLFEDGSVVLLPTPGHTRGSMSVLVQSSRGRVLYLGDAAWVDANWLGPTPKGFLPRTLIEADWKLGIDGLHRVKAWAAADPSLVVIAGHDPGNQARFPWPAALFEATPGPAGG